MENYQKEINKLENIIFDDENLNQINKIKFEIKNVKERLNTLEKEKKSRKYNNKKFIKIQ